MQESLTLATEALELTNVADDINNVDDATSALIATMRGFNLEADSAGSIVDKLNEVSNNFAVTIGDLATGISKESATLAQANNSLDQTIALITGGTEVMRDASRVATGLRTIALRLRGVGEEGEPIAELMPKLEEYFNKFGLTLIDTNGKFKSTYDILKDLAGVYENLSAQDEMAFAKLSELISGQRQSTVLNAVLSNWERVEEAMQSSINSIGSAARENAKYIDSIQGKTEKFASAVQKMWKNTISSDTIKLTVDLGTEVINLIDKVGLLNTAFIALFTTLWVTGKLKALNSLMQDFGANIAVAVNNMGLGANAALNFGQAIAKIGPMLAVTGIVLLVKALKDASEHIQNMADDVAEAWRNVEESRNAIRELGREYEDLAQKTNLTSDDKLRLLEIERQLKTAFGEAGEQIDFQTKSLKENKEAIEALTEAQAQQFLLLNQGNYREALDKLSQAYSIRVYSQDSTLYGEGLYSRSPALLATSGTLQVFKDLDAAIAAAAENVQQLTGTQNKLLYDMAVEQLRSLYNQRDALKSIVDQYEAILYSTSEAAEKQYAMAKSTWRNLESVESLTSQFNTLTGNINDLYKSLEEISDEGTFSPSTLDDLVQKYPEVIQYLHDHAQLQEFLKNKINEYETTQIEAYKRILLQSETFFNATLEGYTELYNQLALAYGKDAENFKSLAEVKAETDDYLIQHLGANWAEYYGTQEEALRALRAQYVTQRNALATTGSAMFAQYQSMINQIDAQIKVLSTVSDAFDNLKLDFTPINVSGVGGSKSGSKIVDAIEDLINSQIDALQKKIDAEQKIIDQLKEQYDKEKALAKIEELRLDIVKKREELANINKERNVRLYNPETGRFEWVADPREVQRAEEELSDLQKKYNEARRDYQRDMEIKKHQDLIKSYNEQIDALREYLSTLEDLTKKSVDEQLAEWKRLQGGGGPTGGKTSSSTSTGNQAKINKLQEELRTLWLRYNELKNSGQTARTAAYNDYTRKREEIIRLGGVPQYEKGGKIPNTGLAMLHAGEIVLNKPTAQLYENVLMPFVHNLANLFKRPAATISDGNGRVININEINVSSNDPQKWVDGLEALVNIRK
jgi:TP901 family phage tail tape measure protein